MPSIHSSYRLKSLFTHFPTIGPSSTYIWAISAAPASNPFGRCYSVKFQQTERRGKWISRCTILRRRIRDITKSQSLFSFPISSPSLRTEKKSIFSFPFSSSFLRTGKKASIRVRDWSFFIIHQIFLLHFPRLLFRRAMGIPRKNEDHSEVPQSW